MHVRTSNQKEGTRVLQLDVDDLHIPRRHRGLTTVHVDPTELKDLAERYTAAWCTQNGAAVALFFSEHGSLTVNGGTPAAGRCEIAKLAQSFMTTFPDLNLVMDDLRIQVDTAEYHWTLTGTSTGPEGTGHKVRISGFERWRMGEDGLIASSEGHFDEADYRQQLERGSAA